jgi:hypothetical protein
VKLGLAVAHRARGKGAVLRRVFGARLPDHARRRITEEPRVERLEYGKAGARRRGVGQTKPMATR